MKPMPTQRMTPATKPVVAKTEGILREPRAIAVTIRQTVNFFQPLEAYQ